MMTFANRLNDLLIENNFSQRKLSKIADIPLPTISSWLCRGTNPNLEALEKLADVFNCSIDYISGRCDIDNIVVIKNNLEKSLSKDEITILEIFRNLTTRRQAMALGYIAGLLDEQRKNA